MLQVRQGTVNKLGSDSKLVGAHTSKEFPSHREVWGKNFVLKGIDYIEDSNELI